MQRTNTERRFRWSALSFAASLLVPSMAAAQPGLDGGVDAAPEVPIETVEPAPPEEAPAEAPPIELAIEPEAPDERSEERAVEETQSEDERALDGIEEVDEIANLDLEALLRGDVVLSVSRSAERVEETPATVTVITREQLLRWGYRSVADLLQRIAGFYVIDDHVVPNVAVRGISGGLRAESGLLKVMIDGRPVQFRPTGGNWLGPELIPLSVVERVEIIRGPASTVYGADAFLGVNNVVTRDPSLVSGADLRLEGNWAGGPGGGFDLTVGGRYGNVSGIAAVRLDHLNGSGLRLPDSSPAPTLRTGVADDARARLILDSATVFTRFTYHFDEDNSIAVTGHFSMLDRSGEFADWLQLGSGLDASGRQRGSQITMARGHVDIEARLQPLEQLGLRASVTYFTGRPFDSERFDVGSDVFYVRRELEFNALSVDLGMQWDPLPELRFVAGGDMLFDRETLPGTLQVLFGTAGDSPPGSVREETSVRQGERDFYNGGGYLLGRWAPIPELRVNAGIRVDGNSIYGAQVNGRGGFSLHPTDWFAFKLNYNSAFRAPTTLLLYGVPLAPGDIVGNASLRPQQIHTLETNFLLDPAEWIRFETTFAYSHVIDKASFTTVGVNSVARNLAQLDVLSWETELRVDWEEQLWGYANVGLVAGWQSLEASGYVAQLLGDGLEVYPTAIVNAGLGYQFVDFPLRITVEGRFLSDRRASDSNVIENGSVYTLPAAFYLNASIALVRFEALENQPTTLTFSVQNILDTRAAHPGFAGIDYPSARRTFMLVWQQEL
jgi:outer membrane receptor for ferrienterochelin and colicins